jgi:exopolyphosphatase / guanosine-5'-triphosphate,3'-diphosphate pyrophosphatase
MRVAVVDLGTNTTRLLVADVGDHQVTEVERRNAITRLGEGVDSGNRLLDAAMERVFGVLAEYRRAIDELGAERTLAVATSAVRDAENGEEFRLALRERFGLEARIISGDEEAQLTFAGATLERDPGGEPLMVLDIGGGSTEFVIGRPGERPSFHVSTQAGSVRQTERHLHTDPPSEAQVEELRSEIRGIVENSVPQDLRSSVTDGVAVAGTPTSMAAIDQRLEPYDPSRVHGYRLSFGTCERIERMLAALPETERREVPGLHPERAATIVAGAVILVESMRAFGLESIQVGEQDILYGAALKAAL